MDVRLNFAPNVGAPLVAAGGFLEEAPPQAGFRRAQQIPPLHRLLDKTWLIRAKPPRDLG